MLGTPLQALVGLAADGRVAWLNGTAQQLLGQGSGPGHMTSPCPDCRAP